MGTQVSGVAVPFLPSFAWYARYAAALLAGSGEDEARRRANEALALPAKEFSRASLRPGVRLKVPLEGGSSAKRLPPEQLVISGHGDWHRSHLGTFSAIFGRSPFYLDLADDLERAYARYGEAGMPLAAFSQELHLILRRMILPDQLLADFPTLPAEARMRALARGHEILSGIDPQMSLTAVIMQSGPETLLPLLAFGADACV